MDANSYLAIAVRNIETSRKLLEWGDYNESVRLSQQVVEKVLKHILETTNDASVTKFMKLHKLPKLYSEAEKRNTKILPITNKDILATLTLYYFDANYPGEDFVLLGKDEAKRLYEFAKNFIDNTLLMMEAAADERSFYPGTYYFHHPKDQGTYEGQFTEDGNWQWVNSQWIDARNK